MYILNIKALKKDLVNGPLPEKETIKYLLPFLLFTGLGSIFHSKHYDTWSFIWGLSSFAITLLGTLYIYKINFGSSGVNFLQRYLVVGLVVGIRITLFCVIPGLMIIILIARIVFNNHGGSKWYIFLFYIIIDLIMYWRIGFHVGQIANGKCGDGL